MKVAIPVFKNSVSPRIDVSDSLLVYNIHRGKVKHKESCYLSFEYPAELAAYLREHDIKKIICGGCPKFYLRTLQFYGVEVAPDLTGDPESIIKRLREIGFFKP